MVGSDSLGPSKASDIEEGGDLVCLLEWVRLAGGMFTLTLIPMAIMEVTPTQ